MANLPPPRGPKSNTEVDIKKHFDFTHWLGLQCKNGQTVYLGNTNLHQNELPAMLSDRIHKSREKEAHYGPHINKM